MPVNMPSGNALFVTSSRQDDDDGDDDGDDDDSLVVVVEGLDFDNDNDDDDDDDDEAGLGLLVGTPRHIGQSRTTVRVKQHMYFSGLLTHIPNNDGYEDNNRND